MRKQYPICKTVSHTMNLIAILEATQRNVHNKESNKQTETGNILQPGVRPTEWGPSKVDNWWQQFGVLLRQLQQASREANPVQGPQNEWRRTCSYQGERAGASLRNQDGYCTLQFRLPPASLWPMLLPVTLLKCPRKWEMSISHHPMDSGPRPMHG